MEQEFLLRNADSRLRRLELDDEIARSRIQGCGRRVESMKNMNKFIFESDPFWSRVLRENSENIIEFSEKLRLNEPERSSLIQQSQILKGRLKVLTRMFESVTK